MLTEITYLAISKPVKKITVGVFPSKGRYFRKEMDTKDGIFFNTSVIVPEGKSYYHLFADNNFDEPIRELPGLISSSDPQGRIQLNEETDIFCSLIFLENGNYYGFLNDDLFELRAISLHDRVTKVHFVNEDGLSVPLNLDFRYRNKKFWSLRIPKDKITTKFLLKIKGRGWKKFFHTGNFYSDTPWFAQGFLVGNNTNVLEKVPCINASDVGYQVFPDRFMRSRNAVKNSSLLSWDDTPDFYTPFGGDLKGITEKLPYIKKLGSNFIYVNPIFHSRYAHRYDVIDYMAVDPLLGSLSDFHEMVEQAHKLGLKIILDIPVNHCNIDFFAFADVLKYQEKSRYVKWFNITGFPVRVESNPSYSCWSGYKEYPQFNFDNEEVWSYFLKISEFWTREFGIDGWRLDCSSEIKYTFIAEFIRASRLVNSGILVIGENWYNALELLDYGADGISNYGLYWNALIPFFERNGSVERLAFNIIDHYHHSPLIQQRYSWNFLSNHDLPRFYSIIRDKGLYPLAFALIFSLPGTPIVYYGEEINMEGLQDPDNRRGMNWNETLQNYSSTKTIQLLTKIRKTYSKFFIEGHLSIPYASSEKELLIIVRALEVAKLLFVFNFSSKKAQIDFHEFSNQTVFLNILTMNKEERNITIPKFTFTVLKTL